MSLGAHLIELRKRLFIIAAGVVVAMIAGFVFSEWAIDQMAAPITEIADDRGQALLNFDAVTSAFDLRMKVALTLGIVASSPIWLYQIWAFLVPGLTRKEIGYALGFLLSAVPLFLAGCAAGWWVMPHIVELMVGFTPANSSNFFNAGTYFDFVLKLLLAVGIAFVVPVFLVLLNFVGVLSAATIIKSWRIAILVIVLFCAIATPAADVISMFVLAIPMVVLYFASYGIAWVHDRRAAKRQAALDAELAL
ncbi:twin-arginine translocase subunit TatC [Mycetocola zhadangensis]|uniref:Sec-independent protein translocase protein TatC n=1 Tax=Mycetocola zhadangensis TaxID=1164595 RepID=A0A3L7J6A3_9MICO|nr:twin-arginine translocase subunit TatC [Mycetocola zhadangensis]RLQ86248.1 twin-arginine translocase subunit TatC [Mycetocola zhadangensis]